MALLDIISLIYLTIYTGIGRLCIRAEIKSNISMIIATKPLLMPLLVLVIRPIIKKYPKDQREGLYLLSISLIFAFFGDVFLLPSTSDNKDLAEISFMLGLLSFLIMQIIYIIIFNNVEGVGIVTKYPLLILPYIMLYVVVNYIINPYVDDLLIPVLVYSACLIYMNIHSLNLIGKISLSHATTITIGSLLFAISDAIIAFQKFKIIDSNSINQGAIMFTYILAQLLIIVGYILGK